MARVFKKDRESADWWIDYNDVYGRRRREKVGPNRALAQQVLGERLKRIVKETELGIKQPPKKLFEEFVSDYLQFHAKPNKRSWSRDEGICRLHLVPFFGGRFLTEISAQDIERFKAKRAAAVSAGTANRELACLKTVFSKAVEWGFLPVNPAARVKLFRLDNRRLVFLERHECRSLVESCPKHLKALVEVALLTGMRRGELFRLVWQDLDFKAGVIHVLQTKSGKPRHLPMSARLKQLFRALPEHVGSNYVFPSDRTGDGWSDLKASFLKAVKRAGIRKHVSFHTLRHTFASQLAMSGVDMYTISQLLGHASIETTQRYAHLSPDHKQLAMEKVGDLARKVGTDMTPETSEPLRLSS